MSGLFYQLGRQVGRAAIPAMRKSKWIWDSLTGTEAEALRAETAFGRVLAGELRAASELVNAPPLVELVNGVCERLSGRVRDKRRKFRCELIAHSFPNAMALPGGYIFVSQSLVDFCGAQPDELAFVLGHEMGHILRGHTWARMLNQAALQAATAMAARAGPLAGWLRRSGLELLQSAHAQDSELEADELGFRLSVAAGFDPGGAIALLRRLERLGGEREVLGQYFSSHPAPSKRIAQLTRLRQQLASRAP